ncbi:MAG: MlaD family protein [Chitinophagaceae bacterium]
MAKRTISNVKLGVFVLAGLLFLILLLYMIGRNDSLFGSNFKLRVRFENVQGLSSGNNVRYAGIQVGTVKSVSIVNDTSIEVTMHIETRMLKVIRKNAVASIGTEGIMGNKVLNISPVRGDAPLVEENDELPVDKKTGMDDMWQTLSKTNNDIAFIADQLKQTVTRINNSKALWQLLDDEQLAPDIKQSVKNIRVATARANDGVGYLEGILADIKQGKGSLGRIIADSTIAIELQAAIDKIGRVGEDADSLANQLRQLAQKVDDDLQHGPGTANALLNDTALANNLTRTMENLRQGTEGFNEVIEALKHNFLLRGYFRKQERRAREASNR